MVFAKNELLWDNNKVSILLDIMWRLLEFKTGDEEQAEMEELSQNPDFEKS